MTALHWSHSYLDLPWFESGASRAGVACWGLCLLIYAEQLDIDLPDYAANVPSIAERASIAAAFAHGTRTGPWHAVPASEIRAFDILVFRRAGLDAHVGIAVDGRRMLHVTEGRDSAIEIVSDGRWAPRLSAVYRHVALIEGGR